MSKKSERRALIKAQNAGAQKEKILVQQSKVGGGPPINRQEIRKRESNLRSKLFKAQEVLAMTST